MRERAAAQAEFRRMDRDLRDTFRNASLVGDAREAIAAGLEGRAVCPIATVEQARERFRKVHGPRREEAAHRLALLALSEEVYRRSILRLEDAVDHALEAEKTVRDWVHICEGLAGGVAEALDALRPGGRLPAGRLVRTCGWDGVERELMFTDGEIVW